MTAATTSPLPPTQAKPRRRWWLRGMIVFGALASLGFAGSWYYSDYAVNKAWEDAEAEADRLDPRWRLAEIEADREVIPDEENAAIIITAFAREAERKAIPWAASHDEVFDKYPPTARMNDRQLKRVRFKLSAVPKALLERAHQLHKLPRGRFQFKHSDDYYSTSIYDLHFARGPAHWLLHEAYVCMEEEKYHEAANACHTVLNIGHAIGYEPSWLSCSIRNALQLEAICTLERVLAQGEISSGALETMQIRFEKDIANSSWLTAVRSDRAGAHHFFTNVRKGKVAAYGQHLLIGKDTPESFSEWITYLMPTTAAKHYPETLHYMNGTIEVAKLPIHERLAKIKEREATREGITNPAARIVPTLQRLHMHESDSQALLRSAAVALACERYRLKHDEWPATLDVLVQAKLLAAVPTDPIDNQPLRFRNTKDGIVIYSIGPDEKDNGGTIDRTKIEGPGLDIGFRLWNWNLRRQQAIAAPEEK